MNSKTLSSTVGALLIFGGAVFVTLGGLHAIYTLLDLRHPRRLAPSDPAVVQAMAHSTVRMTHGGTDMWSAWVGFNFTHSLGLLLFGAMAIWTGIRWTTFPTGFLPGLILIACVYLMLSIRYFFRAPTIGVSVATVCFAAAWLLRLH